MGLRGRYIKDIELHLPDNEIEEEIKHFLQSWDFYPTVWKEESCFCADYKDLNGMGSNIESLKRMYFLSLSMQMEYCILRPGSEMVKMQKPELPGHITS